MKTKNRTFKIILLLTLSILMLAIMAIFPLVNNASAEENINTTDKYINRSLAVGDSLQNLTINIDRSNIVIISGATSIFTSNNYELRLDNDAQVLEIYNDNNLIETIFNPMNYTEITTYQFSDVDFGVITSITPIGNLTAFDFITAEFLNPDYVEPEPTTEPTEEPENPINEITDFFSNASVAAIILLVLGSFVVYSIIKK